ncbi:MAG: hypothetical protein HZB25_03805 [Candidatus Eisenbacteria bacterium]|nr:hypothetical protein [Candidatus Eisenbacteria bacterium]
MYSAYLDTCRAKRNEMSYVHATVITTAELDEILTLVPEFRTAVDGWLRQNHAELCE